MSQNPPLDTADQLLDIRSNLIHMARFGAEGRVRDVKALARKLASRYREAAPEMSSALAEIASAEGMLRDARRSVPVDADTRLALARAVSPQGAERPFLSKAVNQALVSIINERLQAKILSQAGLSPIRTLLLVGPPGTGKTMTARWLASQLNRPFVVLDLAAAISSFLGKTGQNLRQLFDYAQEFPCVLLLDEVDAVAKTRSDESDIGELKRLVNVLLQQLDEWPDDSLLIAATNHPDLLDAAIWRRFDEVIHFGIPAAGIRQEIICSELPSVSGEVRQVLATLSEGMTAAELVGAVRRGRKAAILSGSDAADAVLEGLAQRVCSLARARRAELCLALVKSGSSQRRASELTGVSRNTVRKKAREER